MVVEVDFDIIDVLSSGNIQVLNDWITKNQHKKNYDGLYTTLTNTGHRMNLSSLGAILSYKYHEIKMSKSKGEAYASLIGTCGKHLDMVCFLVEHGIDKIERYFIKDVEVIQPMAKMIYEHSQKIKQLELSLIEKQRTIDDLTTSNTSLLKEIHKKNQIIDKYHQL